LAFEKLALEIDALPLSISADTEFKVRSRHLLAPCSLSSSRPEIVV
jgi:hypothetical protein